MVEKIVFAIIVLACVTGCQENDEKTPVNHDPSPIELLEPQSGEENVSPGVSFKWTEAIDPDGDNVSYELYADTNANPIQLIYAGSETTFTPDERLSLYDQYNWKVIAKDERGGSATSEIYSFTTRGILVSQRTAAAQFNPRINNTCLHFDNKLWIIGGSLDRYGIDRQNDIWSSADGIVWTQVTPNGGFSPRGNHASTVFDDKMWVVGGTDDTGIKNDVWFSENGITWTLATAAAGFSKRAGHTVTTFHDKLWVIGGVDENEQKNDVWNSSDGVTWTQATAAAAFGPRFGHSSIVFDNRMWVMGGKADAWSSTDGISWKEEVELGEVEAFKRQYFVCGVFDNKIWIAGGITGGDVKKDIWFSKDGASWTQATPSAAFAERGLSSSAVYDNKLWVIGGIDKDNMLNDVWFID